MLGHNETQLDSYNKNIPKTSGTLIANWYEERVHRQKKGEGRAATKHHQPKKHQDLLLTGIIPTPAPQDDTKFRVLGQNQHPLPKTQNYHYGKGIKKADSFARAGKKHQLLEQLYLNEVKLSIDQDQKNRQKEGRKRQFETTNKTTFTLKPLDQNRVGKLIMYDQNGVPVAPDNIDDDLKESLDFKDRAQISSDQQLRRLVDTNVGYERQQPATFWRQKLTDNTFYISKNGSNQPFAKNNEFLKTFQQYKHYKD